MGFMEMFKKKDPKDMVREWQSKLRTEMRGIDRQVRGERRERGREQIKRQKKKKKCTADRHPTNKANNPPPSTFISPHCFLRARVAHLMCTSSFPRVVIYALQHLD